MLTTSEYNRICEDAEAIRFSNNLALENTGAYSTEELLKRVQITDANSAVMEDAMREDFQSLPENLKPIMFNLLASTDAIPVSEWERMLDYHVA